MKRTVLSISCVSSLLLLTPTFAQPTEKQVLITGFGPWGWRTSNPSWEGAKRLEGEQIEGHTVVTRKLEVDYRKVREAMPKLLDEVKRPAVVIHFGVGGSRYEFEQRARNQAHWGDDDSGYAPVDGRVADDGAMLYTSGLPEEAVLEAHGDKRPKMKTSDDAGAYLCEFTFYLAMYHQDKRELGSSAGFIHVPYINETSVTAEKIAQVMRDSIRACLRERPAAEPAPIDTAQRKAPPAEEKPDETPAPGAANSLPEPGADPGADAPPSGDGD